MIIREPEKFGHLSMFPLILTTNSSDVATRFFFHVVLLIHIIIHCISHKVATVHTRPPFRVA